MHDICNRMIDISHISIGRIICVPMNLIALTTNFRVIVIFNIETAITLGLSIIFSLTIRLRTGSTRKDYQIAALPCKSNLLSTAMSIIEFYREFKELNRSMLCYSWSTIETKYSNANRLIHILNKKFAAVTSDGSLMPIIFRISFCSPVPHYAFLSTTFVGYLSPVSILIRSSDIIS